MNPTQSQPRGLAALGSLLKVDLSTWNTHSRVELRVDRFPRVTLRRGLGERIELEARLPALPRSFIEREALLDRLMVRATAGAATRVGTLTLSSDFEQLLLQASMADDDAAALSEGLEAFLNDLDYWVAVIGEHS